MAKQAVQSITVTYQNGKTYRAYPSSIYTVAPTTDKQYPQHVIVFSCPVDTSDIPEEQKKYTPILGIDQSPAPKFNIGDKVRIPTGEETRVVWRGLITSLVWTYITDSSHYSYVEKLLQKVESSTSWFATVVYPKNTNDGPFSCGY